MPVYWQFVVALFRHWFCEWKAKYLFYFGIICSLLKRLNELKDAKRCVILMPPNNGAVTDVSTCLLF